MESRARTLLITGATGFIGRRVVEAALAAGFDVRTLSRRDWLGRPWVPVRNRFLGAFPYQVSESAFEGVHAVIHLANTTGSESDAAARAVNVEGTRVLMEKSEAAEVRKIVYISSQSARPDAVSAYGKTKLEAEGVLRAGWVPVTVLRPGLVYGRGTRDIFNRMVGIVRKLPVIPLLGGGKAAVQPIHVDDLADAILRCTDPYVFNSRVLNLGAATPITLREFLRKISVALYNKSKLAVTIPLGPIVRAVAIAESMGIKLPVSKNNLQGLQKVEKMETAASLRELGLVLRPLDEGLRDALRGGGETGPSDETDVALDKRGVAVALVGAGRIGLMHSVTGERQQGMRLAAYVDKNPKATKFLHGMGFSVPARASIDDAMEGEYLDGAIIATPPRFHLPLLKECAARGLAVLIEKPLARSPKELARFREFAGKHKVQAGYLAPSYPQFREALGRLRDGRFGAVTGFEAFSLQSLFPSGKRWEVDPRVSGGGVLINLGGHVLSWMYEAFGRPKRLQAEHKSVTSEKVEDSMVIRLDYDTFSGLYCTSWTIGGFSQAENRLIIHTELGRLYCSNTVAAFVNSAGRLEWFRHQVDYDFGFNFSPDYIGGAITAELNQFQQWIRSDAPPVMPLSRGMEFEQFLFFVYNRSRTSETFRGFEALVVGEPGEVRKKPRTRRGGEADAFARLVDVRPVLISRKLRRQLEGLERRWDGVQITAGQVRPLMEAGVDTDRMTVVVPDFMNYARQINSGHAAAFLRSLGVRSTFSMGLQAIRSVAGQKGVTFWAVAQSLLAADLARLPRDFDGTVLLHSFLADLTAGLTRGDLLASLVARIRMGARFAAVGVQTNIVREVLNQLVYLEEPIQALHFLSSPNSGKVRAAVEQVKSAERLSHCRLVAEVGAVPSPLYGEILRKADTWLNGAEGVVVDGVCDPVIARFRRRTLAQAWKQAFPGLSFPDSAL